MHAFHFFRCSAAATRQRLMRFRRSKSRTLPDDAELSTEAAEWLVRLQDTGVDPEEPYPDPVERRAGHPDPQRLIKIQELLDASPADVIQLFDPPTAGQRSFSDSAAKEP